LQNQKVNKPRLFFLALLLKMEDGDDDLGSDGNGYEFESVDDLKNELRKGILTLIDSNAKLIQAHDGVAEDIERLQELAKKLE